jgi:hypothetical protein
MMVERYPNFKEEVGGSNPGYEKVKVRMKYSPTYREFDLERYSWIRLSLTHVIFNENHKQTIEFHHALYLRV